MTVSGRSVLSAVAVIGVLLLLAACGPSEPGEGADPAEMTPDEARQMLGLKGLNSVNF